MSKITKNKHPVLLACGRTRLMSLKENQELSKKFVNFLMVGGKKNIAYKIFSAANYEFVRLLLNKGKEEKKNDKNTLLFSTIKNVQPSLEGRKCRVAGTTKIVPAIVSEKRGCALAIRWIIESAEKRRKTSKMPFFRCLAQELLDAFNKQGGARQRRDQYHKTCQSNRGNLRYRWW